ncbi:hypothetical protein RCL1_002924 [Eukaryota sp. TZLM3-RCL]
MNYPTRSRSGSYVSSRRCSSSVQILRTSPFQHRLRSSRSVSSPYKPVLFSNSLCHYTFLQCFLSFRKPLFEFKSPNYVLCVHNKHFLHFANKVINVSSQTRRLFFQSLQFFFSLFSNTNVLCGPYCHYTSTYDASLAVTYFETSHHNNTDDSRQLPVGLRHFPVTSLTNVPLSISNSHIFNYDRIISIEIKETFGSSQLQLFVNLQKLVLKTYGLSSIEVVKHLPLLSYLDVSGTRLTDLTPLSTNPKLTVLNLTSTRVTNIEILAFCNELIDLSLSNTNVHDISPLSQCNQLKVLNLNGTKVTDLTSLSALTQLEHLRLATLAIADLSPFLACKRLSLLDVRNTLVKKEARIEYTTCVEVQKFFRSFQNGFTCDLNGSKIDDLFTVVHCLAPRLNHLILGQRNISNVSLLQMCINLKFLDISWQRTTLDFSFLQSLASLIELNLSNSKFMDCSVLSSCSKLQSLNLCSTYVADLLPLLNCPELSRLNLINTFVAKKNQHEFTTRTSLVELLKSFSNGFSCCLNESASIRSIDLSPYLDHSRLLSLDVTNSKISDISSVALCAHLHTLILEGTKVNDYSVLPSISKLETLSLARTTFSQFSILSGCSNLKNLDLSHLTINDVSGLSNCLQLTSLNLSGTCVSDLSPLKNCKKLSLLLLSNAQKLNLLSLSALPKLTVLNLTGAKIANIETLAFCKKLKDLSLSNTNVQDISPLSQCNQLKVLNLSFTKVVDISSLSVLTNLEQLRLEDVKVADLFSLLNCKRLSLLDARGTLLKKEDRREHKGHAKVQKFLKSFQNGFTCDLSECKIDDLSSVVHCLTPRLNHLSIRYRTLSNTSLVQMCSNLKFLDMSWHTTTLDFSFLQSLTSVVELNLSNSKFIDCSVLSSCSKLQSLNLCSTYVADLLPLIKCPALSILDLSYTSVAKQHQRKFLGTNQVKTFIQSLTNGFAFEIRDACQDLSCLKENDRLVSFSCGSTYSRFDFSVLTTCKNLRMLSISDSSRFPYSLLPSISQLREVHLTINNDSLFSNNDLGLSILAECNNLRTLKLSPKNEKSSYRNSSFHISELVSLPPYPQIKTLDLSKFRNLVNFNFFTSFSGLRSLNLNGTSFTDPWQLHSCTNLSFLDLRRTLVAERHRSVHRGKHVISKLVASYTRGFEFNALSRKHWIGQTLLLPRFVDCNRLLTLTSTSFRCINSSDLSRCKIIETLALIECSFFSIDNLSSLVTLKRIDFSDSEVQNVSFVSSLTNLVSVNFSNTQVSDLNPLSDCKSILQVFLSNTPVSNLSPLAACTHLEVLNLRNTKVDDISCLVNCRNLNQIDLRDTLLPANFRVEMKGKEEIHKVLKSAAIRSLTAHQHQSNKLWVRNFPESFNDQDLVELFQRFGLVEKCVVSTSSAGKVSATVHFRDIESANYAVQGLRGQSIGSCTLSLVYI